MTSKTPSAVLSEDDRAVRDLLQDLYSAWAENDADAFAALYVDDATSILPGGYRKGKDEIRAYMAAGFAGPMKGSRAIDEVQSVRVYGGDTAIVISESGILMAGETELPADRLRRATWTLTKQGGTWRIAAYHNCAAN